MLKYGHLRLTSVFRYEYDERSKTVKMIPMGDIAPPKTNVDNHLTYHLTNEENIESVNI